MGTVTVYGVGGPGIEFRQEAREFLFYKSVQTGSGAHPAFCLMATGVLYGG